MEHFNFDKLFEPAKSDVTNLIDVVAKRLKNKGLTPSDSHIVAELSQMTYTEIVSAIS